MPEKRNLLFGVILYFYLFTIPSQPNERAGGMKEGIFGRYRLDFRNSYQSHTGWQALV